METKPTNENPNPPLAAAPGSEPLQIEARIYNGPGHYRVLAMEGTGSGKNNADVAALLRKLASWVESPNSMFGPNFPRQ